MAALRTALVTGATRGIGRAVLEQLVAAGRRVVASARDAATLETLERAHPGRVVALASDLALPGAAVQLVADAERRVGPLDELVLAAGIVRYAPVGEITDVDLHAQLALNFVAPLAMLQEAGVRMRQRGSGAMVCVASTLARHPAPETAAYAASKAALVSAARTFARELAPSVRVNVVSPGVVDTEMVRVPRRPLAAGEQREAVVAAQLDALRALHPLGRLGSPHDVAAAVLYLLEATWVTGTELTIDGGLTA